MTSSGNEISIDRNIYVSENLTATGIPGIAIKDEDNMS